MNLSKIQPVGKKVLVEILMQEPELKSLLVTLNNEPQPTDRCNVLRIGTETTLVQENRKYIYRIGAGVKLSYKDQEYTLLDENDFYAEVDQ